MLETTSQPTSTDQGSPSSTAAPAGGVSQTSAQTTSPATPTSGSAGAPAPIVASRPEGVPESFWDKDKGEAKFGDWSKAYEELRSFKAADDARRATLPAQADLYKPELPQDFKLPKGWELKTDDPLYLGWRAFAHESGLSQEAFSKGLKVWAATEVAKHEALQTAIKARDESLGQNGPQRVDELNKWFTATFGADVGKQFANTLFTKDIITGFEKLKGALSKQGVVSFSGAHRETVEGRTDGRPDNWDAMSSLDRRMWDLQNRGKAAA